MTRHSTALWVVAPVVLMACQGSSSGDADAGGANGSASAGDRDPLSTCLGAQVVYRVGNRPAALAAAKLGGEGGLDLAVANAGDDTVGVLLNHAGSFAAPVTYPVGHDPASVAVGDFDGDGFPDLAVANRADGTVGVLLGQRSGGFAEQKTWAAGAQPSSLAVADFNGDGRPDLAVSNEDGVRLLLNQGDANFSAAGLPLGLHPNAVVVGDFNGDGRPDLALTNSGAEYYAQPTGLHVLLNQGDGTFAPAAYYPAGLGPSSLAVGDFDGDGTLDIVVGGYLAVAGGAQTVSVFLNHGDGTFAAQVPYAAGSPSGVAVGDFNGDGQLDFAVANQAGIEALTVSLFLNRGDGTFAPAASYPAGLAPRAIVAGAFNGGGEPGLAVINSADDFVGVLVNECLP